MNKHFVCYHDFFYEFSYWVVSTNWNDFCKRLAISTTHKWEKDIKKKHWSSFPAVKLILYAKSKSNFDHFYASTWTETEPGLWVEQISWSMKQMCFCEAEVLSSMSWSRRCMCGTHEYMLVWQHTSVLALQAERRSIWAPTLSSKPSKHYMSQAPGAPGKQPVLWFQPRNNSSVLDTDARLYLPFHLLRTDV